MAARQILINPEGKTLNLTKAIFAAGVLTLASVSSFAFAQDTTVDVEAGVTIYGPQGNVVGTIENVTDGVATLDTGTYKVGLPVDRFGKNAEQQTTIAVTQAQLNEMAAQAEAEAAAKLDAALVAGASVVDVNGVSLGSVARVEGEDVTVSTEWGTFALKRENFVAGEGNVTAQVLADQVKTTLSATAGASAS